MKQAPHHRTDITCPECGEPPTDESVTEVRLSDLGYFHGDHRYKCDCGNEWLHGVPVGDSSDSEMALELTCDACGGGFLVHRVIVKLGYITLDLKCPDCYRFKKVNRDLRENKALVGYPEITGELNPENPDGY